MAFKWRAKRAPAEDANENINPEAGIGAAVTDQGTDQAVTRTVTTATQDIEYPHGLKLILLTLSIFVAMFLVSLDRLIIATAIPKITDEFHSEDDIGWYGSAYQLTLCACQLLFGKLYGFYSVKWTFLSSIALFEIGSAIDGAAPNSIAFIIGRAIAGIGAAGLMCGVLVIITYAVPLHKRPMYQGLFGAVFGVASVVGPLLGGVFTTKVSWRWCFYINLPFGGVAMLFVIFLLDIPERESTKMSNREKLAQLDAVGTALLAPGTVCLLLALQWGGLTYAWSNPRIIVLFVLAGLLLIGFASVQVLMPKTATVPPRIFLQRSILSGFYSAFCVGSQQMIFIYYLPIWFQAIQGVSAFESGIRTLPLVLSMVVSSILTGILTGKVGYYTPFMIVGICVMSVAAGLLTTLELHTPQAKWVGYQFLYGFGMGMCFQAPNLAAQTVLPRKEAPIGVSLMFFSQLLGGAIFISVGQNVLNNKLLQRLAHVPGFSASTITNSGATTLTQLSPQLRSVILPAYNYALSVVFTVGAAIGCCAIIGALTMEWISVKKDKKKHAAAEEGGEKSASDGDGSLKDEKMDKERLSDEKNAMQKDSNAFDDEKKG